MFGSRKDNGASSSRVPPKLLSKCTPRTAHTIERYAAYYPMNNKRRGKALIFTHAVFNVPNTPLPRRDGSEIDCTKLNETLSTFGFDVDIYRDRKLKDILSITEKVSLMDHSDSDCLLVAILSHGDEGDIIYSNDCPYQLSTVWSQFTGERCKSLVGKPKIFIIQACRGNDLDRGVKVEKDGMARYSIPTHADFLFAFATIQGFMAFRNTTSGSWFINELCNELRENGRSYDLLTLLTFVVQKVAYEYESVSNNPDHSMKKQTPCIVSMLTRLLLLNVV